MHRRTALTIAFVLLATILFFGANPIGGEPAAAASTIKMTFAPLADAYVSNSTPRRNFGVAKNLQSDASPLMRTYMRFDIQGVAGTVRSAQLRVYAMTGSSTGYDVRTVAHNSWQEKAITYSNAPAVGPVLASSLPFNVGAWVSIDVTPLIKANGKWSVALTTNARNVIRIASRESGAYAPQLVVEAAPSISTSTPTKVPTKTPVPSATPLPPTRTPTLRPPTTSPTATRLLTNTPVPSATATSTQTNTLAPAATSVLTNTPLPTATPTSIQTDIPAPSATATSIHTNTPLPTATATSTQSSTPVPSATATATLAATATSSPTPTLSSTPSPTAAANVFYVSTTGSDANPGTQAAPWKTIQKAANTMVAGQTTIVLAGDYSGQRVQVTKPGAPGAMITYKASGLVTMKGFTVKANYIAILGFDISNTDDNWQEGWGIFVQASYCDIENNYVHFAADGGIEVWASSGNETAVANCTLRNNRLYRNALAGIQIHGRNHLVEGNEIWGTIQNFPTWTTPHNGADADGMRFFGQGHVIRSNYIHDIHYGIPENPNPHIDCFQTWAAPGFEAAQDVVIERNLCRNLEYQSAPEGGQGFMIQGASNILIRNNIIQAYRGVNLLASQNVTIVENDVTGDLSASTAYYPLGVVLEKSPNITVQDNIFYNIPGSIYSFHDSISRQTIVAGYNLGYRSDGKPVPGSPYPHDLWGVNPLFVNPGANDFHLKAGSPAIDKAITLTSVTDDRDGALRPHGAGYDIGAYEY